MQQKGVFAQKYVGGSLLIRLITHLIPHHPLTPHHRQIDVYYDFNGDLALPDKAAVLATLNTMDAYTTVHDSGTHTPHVTLKHKRVTIVSTQLSVTLT